MKPITVKDLVELGPEVSWLLLADVIALRASGGREAEPDLAARWADVAADLYEGLIRGSRPQDDLAREVWGRKETQLRTQCAGLVTPNTPPSLTPIDSSAPASRSA